MASSTSSDVLAVLQKISDFALKVEKDLREDNKDVEYDDEELNLTEFVENTVKYLAATLKDRQQSYNFDYLVNEPNRVERLKAHFKETLVKNVMYSKKLDFVEWAIMSCFIAARLFHGGFVEAPEVAIQTVHKMCMDYEHAEEFLS